MHGKTDICGTLTSGPPGIDVTLVEVGKELSNCLTKVVKLWWQEHGGYSAFN